MATNKIPDDIVEALETIRDRFEQEDQNVRIRQIRLWKKMEYFWDGVQKVYWDDTAHDWRVFSEENTTDAAGTDFYDKPINVFRAYLESIIAAMSAAIPPVKCFPKDATSTSDVLTAKGGTKIAELIQDHNNASLLFCKALYIYCTQGMIAAYNYSDENKSYGEVKQPKYDDVEEERQTATCPNCKTQLNPEQEMFSEELSDEERDEYDPGEDDVESHDLLQTNEFICPQCLEKVDPEYAKTKVIVTRLVGETSKSKCRQKIEVLGGLFVKIPNYARCQAETPYLSYCYETHYSNVIDKYPELREVNGITSSLGSAQEPYERWGRLSTQYFGEYPLDTPTVRNWWIRPSAFEMIEQDDIRLRLKKKFPDGVKAVWANDVFCEAVNESLDDHWTLTVNPYGQYIHFDPLGTLLSSIQEITTDLISLAIQTLEHGIGQTFADPLVFDFEAYRNSEAMPGAVYPLKAGKGKNIQDSFYQMNTANFPKEFEPFVEKIQELGQFTSGAVPALWGGNQAGSSRTAAQYSMSRSQSLQRLQTPWKMITLWWKDLFSKAIPAYIKDMMEDEVIVKEENGIFVNTLIRRIELDGKIGKIKMETSDQLPMTQAQVKDVIMQLLQSPNPMILEALTLPENVPMLIEAIGLDDFILPAEDDREKQYEEIQQLLQSEPITGPNGQPLPSVMPEYLVDNHAVESEICRKYLVSEAGRQAKVDSPKGYQNILLHLKMHMQMMSQLNQSSAPKPAAPPAKGIVPQQKPPAPTPQQGAENNG